MAVRLDYEVGMKPLRQIAAEHRLSKSGIDKRAKAEGWTRDLAKRIRAKADAKVNRAMVDNKASKPKPATEAAILEAASDVQARVRLSERIDIQGARKIVSGLFEELAAKHLSQDDIRLLVDAASNVKAMDVEQMLKTYEALMKSLDLGNRAAIAQKLTQALTSLIDAERTAFNIDDRTRGANELVEGLKKLAAMRVD